jgi:hypothetical protein
MERKPWEDRRERSKDAGIERRGDGKTRAAAAAYEL